MFVQSPRTAMRVVARRSELIDIVEEPGIFMRDEVSEGTLPQATSFSVLTGRKALCILLADSFPHT